MHGVGLEVRMAVDAVRGQSAATREATAWHFCCGGVKQDHARRGVEGQGLR